MCDWSLERLQDPRLARLAVDLSASLKRAYIDVWPGFGPRRRIESLEILAMKRASCYLTSKTCRRLGPSEVVGYICFFRRPEDFIAPGHPHIAVTRLLFSHWLTVGKNNKSLDFCGKTLSGTLNLFALNSNESSAVTLARTILLVGCYDYADYDDAGAARVRGCAESTRPRLDATP